MISHTEISALTDEELYNKLPSLVAEVLKPVRDVISEVHAHGRIGRITVGAFSLTVEASYNHPRYGASPVKCSIMFTHQGFRMEYFLDIVNNNQVRVTDLDTALLVYRHRLDLMRLMMQVKTLTEEPLPALPVPIAHLRERLMDIAA